MPIKIVTQTLDVQPGGGTFNLPVTANYQYYYIEAASITLTSSLTIAPTGTAEKGMLYQFKFKGSLLLGVNTFTLFGVSIGQDLLKADTEFDCFYNGSTWEITAKPSFTGTAFIVTNKIDNSQITEPLIASNAVTTTKILDGAITAAKLDTAGKTESIPMQVSFETGFLGAFYKARVPFDCNAVFISGTVAKIIEVSDNAEVTVSNNAGTMSGTLVFSAGATPGLNFTTSLSGVFTTLAADSYVTFTTSKATAGGLANLQLEVVRT